MIQQQKYMFKIIFKRKLFSATKPNDKNVFAREIEEMKRSVKENDPIHIALILCGYIRVIDLFHVYFNSLILMSSSQVNLHLVVDGIIIKKYLQRVVRKLVLFFNS